MQTNHTQPEQPRRLVSSRALFRLFACALLAALGPLLTGCKTNHNRYDLLEAEIRTRERELADTRAQLEQSRNLLRAYEASQSRGGAVPPGPQVGGPFLAVKSVELGRGTGGVDEDAAPGDEGLMVVIVPKDEDGSAMKVPGRALVAAWEITPAGLKNPIGSWEISSDKLRRSWKSGLISTGYFVAVPWQTPPSTERVRVAVRLVTTDGRAYETDRDITVKLPVMRGNGGNVLPYPQPRAPTIPGAMRQPQFPEMPPPGVPSVIPPGTEELPPPAPVGPERGVRLLPPVPY